MFFSATWMSEYKGPIETIEFAEKPWMSGLGVKTDIHGNQWDIQGIINNYVIARPYGYYEYGTSTNWYPKEFIRSWIPYNVRIVKNGLGFTGP